MERKKKSPEEERTIQFLQDNLSTMRKICGWSMQELGDMAGVTKQTISNLENNRTKMSKLQAIGVAHVFFNNPDFDEFWPKPVVKGIARQNFLDMVIEELYHKNLPEEEAKQYQKRFKSAANLIEKGGTLEKVAEELNMSANDLAGVRDRTDLPDEVRKVWIAFQKSPERSGLPSEDGVLFESHVIKSEED